MLGADAGAAAAGKFEHERLAGAAAGRLADDLAAMGLFEDDGHVFAGGVGARAGEQDDGAGEVAGGIGIEVLKGKASRRLRNTPGAIAGDPASGAGEFAGRGFVEEGGEDVGANGVAAAAVFAEVEDERSGTTDLGPVLVPFFGGGVVVEAVKSDVGDVAWEQAEIEERCVRFLPRWHGEDEFTGGATGGGDVEGETRSLRSKEELEAEGAVVTILRCGGGDKGFHISARPGDCGFAVDRDDLIAWVKALQIKAGSTRSEHQQVAIHDTGAKGHGADAEASGG